MTSWFPHQPYNLASERLRAEAPSRTGMGSPPLRWADPAVKGAPSSEEELSWGQSNLTLQTSRGASALLLATATSQPPRQAAPGLPSLARPRRLCAVHSLQMRTWRSHHQQSAHCEEKTGLSAHGDVLSLLPFVSLLPQGREIGDPREKVIKADKTEERQGIREGCGKRWVLLSASIH